MTWRLQSVCVSSIFLSIESIGISQPQYKCWFFQITHWKNVLKFRKPKFGNPLLSGLCIRQNVLYLQSVPWYQLEQQSVTEHFVFNRGGINAKVRSNQAWPKILKNIDHIPYQMVLLWDHHIIWQSWSTCYVDYWSYWNQFFKSFNWEQLSLTTAAYFAFFIGIEK